MWKKILPSLLAGIMSIISAMTYAKGLAADAQAQDIYNENKKNIVVSPSQPQFTIELKSNPTTGYSWYLQRVSPLLIEPVAHYFVPAERKLVGAPGKEVFVFRVRSKGFKVPQQTAIRFIYARPWQGQEGGTKLVFWVSTQGKNTSR